MKLVRMTTVGLALMTAMPVMAQTQTQPQSAQASTDALLPLDEATRGPSIDALQATVYDLIALKHAAHQEHWNVVGPDYYQLHVFYEDLYTDVSPFIDASAERLRALGAPADGRPSAVGQNAVGSAPEPVETDGPKTIADLTANWSAESKALYDRIDATENDLVTQDLLIGIAALIDKQLWQLRVHEEGGNGGQ